MKNTCEIHLICTKYALYFLSNFIEILMNIPLKFIQFSAKIHQTIDDNVPNVHDNVPNVVCRNCLSPLLPVSL